MSRADLALARAMKLSLNARIMCNHAAKKPEVRVKIRPASRRLEYGKLVWELHALERSAAWSPLAAYLLWTAE
jgi:hypothetical protein